jgi:hypothetical protein
MGRRITSAVLSVLLIIFRHPWVEMRSIGKEPFLVADFTTAIRKLPVENQQQPDPYIVRDCCDSLPVDETCQTSATVFAREMIPEHRRTPHPAAMHTAMGCAPDFNITPLRF